ncbi:hypothetical protein [Mycobacterium sp. NPDC050041]|uniref:hypothetical protein n=1 Tax=Mycobacterium sp. NPDC050041 TaxID=3364293 RepID=UPI003C2C7909
MRSSVTRVPVIVASSMVVVLPGAALPVHTVPFRRSSYGLAEFVRRQSAPHEVRIQVWSNVEPFMPLTFTAYVPAVSGSAYAGAAKIADAPAKTPTKAAIRLTLIFPSDFDPGHPRPC